MHAAGRRAALEFDFVQVFASDAMTEKIFGAGAQLVDDRVLGAEAITCVQLESVALAIGATYNFEGGLAGNRPALDLSLRRDALAQYLPFAVEAIADILEIA